MVILQARRPQKRCLCLLLALLNCFVFFVFTFKCLIERYPKNAFRNIQKITEQFNVGGGLQRSNSIINGATDSLRSTEVQPRSVFISPVKDVINFPCLALEPLTKELKQHRQCVRTVNVTIVAEHVAEYECVILRVLNNLPVCIHDPRQDRYISGAVSAGRIWEHSHVKNLTYILQRDLEMYFLDIGSNIGVYSLAAAQVGSHVVAVDINVDNMRLLAKSVLLGNVQNKVTLIWNGLSDRYTKASLVQNSELNVGTVLMNFNSSEQGDRHVETIRLDDLIPLFIDRKLVIKMDVEGHELNVLKGGMKFLMKVNVRMLQLEFYFHRNKDSGVALSELLQNFRFKPYRDCSGTTNLESVPLYKWPADLCFIKISQRIKD